jgi:hypothetical protein
MTASVRTASVRTASVRTARSEDVEEEVIAVMTSKAEALSASRGIPVPIPKRSSELHGLI